ncbi:MAG: hypothetical protein ACOYIG_05025 [Acetivibrionales bacterium]|jgi:hypothetical protein|nr:hypothetical protein [Clostridiaceae bacterium]
MRDIFTRTTINEFKQGGTTADVMREAEHGLRSGANNFRMKFLSGKHGIG